MGNFQRKVRLVTHYRRCADRYRACVGGTGMCSRARPAGLGRRGALANGAGSCVVNAETGLGPLVENFRAARRDLETSVLPLATSVDGRRFSFQASLYGLGLQVGGYVVLEGGGLSRLGQVITARTRSAEHRADAARRTRSAPRRTGRRSRSGTRAAKA